MMAWLKTSISGVSVAVDNDVQLITKASTALFKTTVMITTGEIVRYLLVTAFHSKYELSMVKRLCQYSSGFCGPYQIYDDELCSDA